MDPSYRELLLRLRRARRGWRLRRLAASFACWLGVAAALSFACLLAELLYQPRPAVCRGLVVGGAAAAALAALALAWRAVGRATLRQTACRVEIAAPALGRRLEGALDLGAAPGPLGELATAALAQTAAAYRDVDFSAGMRLGPLRRAILPGLLLFLLACGCLAFANVRAAWRHLLWPAAFARPRPVDVLAPEPEPAPPAVTAVEVRVRPPAYTGLAESVVPKASVLRVPAGSEVLLTVFTDAPGTMPVREAAGHLAFPGGRPGETVALKAGDGGVFHGGFTAREDGNLTFSLLDSGGRSNAVANAYPVEVVPDRLPKIRIAEPRRNCAVAPGEKLEFVVAADDDYGLRDVRLSFRRNQRGEPQVAAAWKDVNGREVMLRQGFVFKPGSFQGGDVVTFYAEADDRAPLEGAAAPDGRRVRSQPLTVTVVDRAAAAAEDKKSLAAVLQKVTEAHRFQLSAHRAAGALKLAAAALDASAISRQQGQARDLAREAAALAEGVRAPGAARVREVLLGLANNEMASALDNLQALAQAGSPQERAEAMRLVLPAQAEALRRLAQILGIVGALAQAPETELGKDGTDLPQRAAEALKKLQDAMEGLKETQKKVVALKETWEKENVDDFTDAQKKEMEELKAAEENWANLLRDVHSDLSKVPPQDFSNPSLLGEVMTVLEEVEMVAASLTAKETVIATTAAETGLELAEGMTTHVEKWLMDKADHTAWKMEEPLADYDTPMAELPDKLEDIVGELVEQEEELMEEAEDQSSSWADSLDKGAGWDAADGPMSNFSAQGVTGNQLPNDTEVGGRSGQGRSGKSHGEMVGDTAIDKGGRKTPARLTPDAFEKGNVKDQSTEASGGATGGGKGGGAGAQGLEGPAAPKDGGAPMPRLQGKQADIRSKAERINLQLKLRGYNTEMLENTLNELRAAEERGGGRYAASGREKRRLADSLRATVDSLAAQARARADLGADLPRDLQREIMNARADDFPAGYEDLVKAYYERISRGE